MKLNSIYCQDCITGIQKIPENSIQLVVTSPPYNVGRKNKKYLEYKDDLSEEEYLLMTSELFSQLKRVLKNEGAIYYNFGYNARNTSLPYKVVKIALKEGLHLQDTIAWVKKNTMPLPQANCLTREFEFIFLFTKSKEHIIRKERICLNDLRKIFSRRIVSNVWYFPNQTENQYSKIKVSKVHKATFPKTLPKAAILLSSDRGDTVLDPFMGTGTTAVACKELNRNYIGFEITREYIKIANKRLAEVSR